MGSRDGEINFIFLICPVRTRNEVNEDSDAGNTKNYPVELRLYLFFPTSPAFRRSLVMVVKFLPYSELEFRPGTKPA